MKHRMEELGMSRWPVTAVGVLLLLQAVGLSVVGASNFSALRFEAPIPLNGPEGAIVGSGFLFLTFLALLAAVGFLRLWSGAWLVAMLLQGLSLVMALLLYLYLQEIPGYLYAAMLYYILVVLYLNSQDVRTVFQQKPPETGP